jgi:pyruvate kinase
MLDSMIKNPVPTRAEVCDIANAVIDGTDYTMLSAETSVGKFPQKAVEVMYNVIKFTEENLSTL